MNDDLQPARRRSPWHINRRTWLLAGGVAGTGLAWTAWDRWSAQTANCFVARHQTYSSDLTRTIRDGLLACGFDPASCKGRRVLLKPNMVEPSRGAPHMTTHPAVVNAAIEIFRDWKASVEVGEAPGHVRDTEMALIEADLAHVLDTTRVPFADLNYQETVWSPNRGRFSQLDGFYFPRSVEQADLIVSMPKMKTHHWMGVTASLKNMYGVIPGSRYGWPKNVLHYSGIPQTVFDINASLPPTIAIVDGIDCMEGDGPIMGSLKNMGLIVVGTNLVATDATVCRIMGLDPFRIPYLQLAHRRQGRLEEWATAQVGEAWESVVSPFQILNRPHLIHMREGNGPLVS